MNLKKDTFLTGEILPVDIVLAPEWWHKHENISFDPDFFFHPLKRVEEEQHMEKVLYNRWGKYGLGLEKDIKKPEIGAVHLAAGFILSEMLGCDVNYSEMHPPQVVPALKNDFNLDIDAAFRSGSFKKITHLIESLKSKFGYVTGDINWGGVLNLAMDLRGDQILTDIYLLPDDVRIFFDKISGVIERFTSGVFSETKSTSVSVNRVVKHFNKPVFLHSECSHTMISEEDYENYLLKYDVEWSKKRPFGIHYCGPDPHRMAESFAKIPHLDFLDAGWGGDIKTLRKFLPDTFINLRLSPVELVNMTNDDVNETITRLVNDSENLWLTGVCCINMDDKVTDNKIDTIFQTVNDLREKYLKEQK